MASIQQVMKAMSDKTRRDILSLLRKEGKMSAGDIAARYDMTQATVSHHLSFLTEAELVTSEKKGKYIYFEINTTVVQELLEYIMSLLKIDGGKDNETD